MAVSNKSLELINRTRSLYGSALSQFGHGFFYHVQGLLRLLNRRGPSSNNTRLILLDKPMSETVMRV
ncbi:hypothetical protein K504DRAFT_456961 [Pleomassaria siparia CBS 279.74]|uniref:Uncharacterized protein n=1 Tax=Pleomassaria siparia CBS 279.74 TaxID=1314801 RepID=A0A6G1KPK4_9PLEO|nr:hypothetical protein K504DRAFT_456961 [Pleomassaria siparia CBS 279.74]